VTKGRAGVVAALALLAVSATARAQQDPRELEAKKACLANRPDRGIEVLAELYAETNDPTYIYNQGRCYQQNGRGADALIRFREYLRKAPGLPAAERADVERVIKELEDQQRQAQAEAAAVAAPPASAPAAEAPPTTGGGDRRALRIAGIVVASFGVAAIATGAYMGYRTQQLSTEVSDDAKQMAFSQSKYDDGQRAEVLQWVGYGVGGVALVTGGLLYLVGTGRFSGGEARPVALAPSVGPGGGGAVLRLVF
jgi:hypothetical protein